MSSLAQQKEQLKKRMLAQPTIVKKKFKVEADEKEEVNTNTNNTLNATSILVQKPPFLYTNTTTPISRQLFEVIRVLKEQNKPLTNNECIRWAAIDIMATPALFEAIKKNERLTYNPKDQTFQFKPRYNIRTPEGLLSLLEKNRGICGMDVKELKESYTDVATLIDDLEAKGSVLVLRNPKDNSARTVYYNDTSYNLIISSEFKQNWHDTLISSSLDLSKELEKVGLKPMTILIPKQKMVGVGSKTKKRRTGRFKVTNTHLNITGADFSKDYVAE